MAIVLSEFPTAQVDKEERRSVHRQSSRRETPRECHGYQLNY